MGRVSRAPHHPGRGTGERTCKGEHLDTGVASEGLEGDDAVLDRVGGSRSYKHGTEDLENGAENHRLAIRDGTGGDRGGPSVGDIVCGSEEFRPARLCRLTSTVVVRVEEGEEGTNREDIVVLAQHGHFDK